MVGDKPDGKPLEQRINECKELIIQNMEKTLQSKMVYMFLKDRKKQADVKTYSVNSKDGIIKMQFVDHEKAKAFYQEANFIDKILIRPFNIYFNLALEEKEMKKYYLEGITEDNQRKLFEAAVKIGVCKLYTSYGATSRAKLKSTGLLSYIRENPIKEEDFKRLKEELDGIGIKISEYIHEKGMKVSLNLVNFIGDDQFDLEQNQLYELAENRAKEIVNNFGNKPQVSHLSIIVKKKDANNPNAKPEDKQKGINKVQTSALFQFQNTNVTYAVYEKVRKGMIKEPLGKVRLFFHNEQNNSYLSLITQGLDKPAEDSEKQFQEKLIEGFRLINKNVVQVNVFPINYNGTYFGRVYLTDEEEGKHFLVDYANQRSKIYHFFKSKNSIIFNISIDSKTLRKIKNAEKKAKETEEKIKKQTEASKRDRQMTRAPVTGMPGGNYPPFNPMAPGGIIGSSNPGGLPMNMNMMGGAMPMPHHNMPPNMPPNMGQKGLSVPPSGMMMSTQGVPASTKDKINNVLRDKKRFLDMPENNAKRMLVECMKAIIEDQGYSNPEATRYANDILKENDVPSTFRFFENPELVRDEIRRLRPLN